ncbi:unnamed protein product (macronuclear) [Paramecium tetraurelia]|uniref:Uncharacterized protein n=1 Tax=Paramecium tetraurelia TaxID=5888 RepID=A0CGW7_PARTE|nr:uncharacterized protein GSPATT00007474001 [Paramecium tetraurelia]CAK70034.1 unnamed protein product [Paramecium tetraurelia]|eukprot:XP_001437431.1 hypothetical protein (macronuclear) [Paramecium tetraurelia strain d4-2]
MWKNKLAEKGNRNYGEIDFSQFQSVAEREKNNKALEPASSVYSINMKGNTKIPFPNIKSKSPDVLKIHQYNQAVIDVKSKSPKAKVMNINSQNLSKQFETFMKSKREYKLQQKQQL